MKKEYILDDGKVRKCDSNLAKMNIFEFIHYYVFHWGYFKQIFAYIYECFKCVLEYGFGLFYNVVLLLFTPITLIVCAIIQIRNAKKRCNTSK